MKTEKNYPNGMLTAAYVFEQYENLDHSEKSKFSDMYRKYNDEQYKQAHYNV